MRTIRLIILSLFVAMLLSNESSAQRDLYNWQISPYAGLLTINNDIEVPSDANSYAYGLRIERRLGNSFTLGIHLSQSEIGDAQNNNASGSFLSLGYHWDNGYLFSKRAAISIFHRIDAGYADRYANLESIDGNTGDLTFGFENGVKLRFGDRITADLALELFSTKTNLVEGDILKNVRYNVWKFGLSYHFGSRNSNFVAPVFVPDNGSKSMTTFEKIGGDELFVEGDSIYNDVLKGGFRDTLLVDTTSSATKKSMNRADSLQIFMYFDSLYERRIQPGTLRSKPDTAATQKYNTEAMRDTTAAQDSIAMKGAAMIADSSAMADTLAIRETNKTLRDTIIYSDTLARSNTTIIADSAAFTDSLKVRDSATLRDTTSAKDSVSTNAAKANLGKDSIITRVDTVYIEKPVSIPQRADSSANSRSEVPQKVDTVYIEKPSAVEQRPDTAALKRKSKSRNEEVNNENYDVSEKAEDEKKNSKKGAVIAEQSDNSNSDAIQSSLDRQNDLLKEQNKEIQRNRQEIAKLSKDNNKSDAGKLIAAGAAGTALGAIVSGGKNKNKTDTVYYESAAAQQALDSLEAELAALKLQYGVTDSTAVIDSANAVSPPIGSYFENDTLRIDSADTSTNDTLTRPTMSDSILGADTLNVLKESPVDSVVAEPANKSAVSAPEPAEDPTTASEEPNKASAGIKGSYPIACTFGLNKTSLDATELQKLDVVVEDLKNDDGRTVLLTGYTDKSGNADYNLQLSKKRAGAVMDYLISKGVSKEKIETEGGGISEGAEKFQPNSRRVEVSIIEK